MTKRPSLTAVMDKGVEHTDALRPAPASLDDSAQSTKAPRKPGKKRLGWVQISLYIPEELRTKVKMKALQQNRDLTDVVAELLEGWVDK